MTDDEDWHVYPSGLEVKGKHHPRILTTRDEEGRLHNVDTLTDERLGPDDPTPEEAEVRSAEHRRQRARSIFGDPVWSVDRVVSWIGYRDVQAIEEPFSSAKYRDSRPVVERQPRIALLRALQEDRIRATGRRDGQAYRIAREDWAFVHRQWLTDRWPECLFARSDVIGLWPEATGPEAPAIPVPTPAQTTDDRRADKAAVARRNSIGNSIRKAALVEIVRRLAPRFTKNGVVDETALLADVLAEQVTAGVGKTCSKRVLKDILEKIADDPDKSASGTSGLSETSGM